VVGRTVVGGTAFWRATVHGAAHRAFRRPALSRSAHGASRTPAPGTALGSAVFGPFGPFGAGPLGSAGHGALGSTGHGALATPRHRLLGTGRNDALGTDRNEALGTDRNEALGTDRNEALGADRAIGGGALGAVSHAAVEFGRHIAGRRNDVGARRPRRPVDGQRSRLGLVLDLGPAFVILKEIREALGFRGIDTDHHAWLAHRLPERVTHVTGQRIGRPG
jgi:hypothetical protein